MLSGVNDVLTPWTPSRILRIMEAAAASPTPGTGGGDRPAPGAVDDGAMAMESLLRLSNQQPDVAGRVMAAPLFAQRPLVEAAETALKSAPSPSPPTLFYADAHRMCTHALQRCRAGWTYSETSKKGEEHGCEQQGLPTAPLLASTTSASADTVPSASPFTVATELEEVAFAAELAEPCLRGSFPDIAAVVRHSVPVGYALLMGRTHRASGLQVHDRVRNTNAVQRMFQSLLQEPPVPYRKPLEEKGRDSLAGSCSSLRLNLTRPAPAVPSNTLLWSSLPSPSAVPISAYGPPGHEIFSGASVAHSFTDAEVADLHVYLHSKSLPFQVYSSSEVRARRQQVHHNQRRSTMPSVGTRTAPIVGPHCVSASSATQLSAPRPRGHRVDDEHDGWSASSWQSSSRSRSSSRECSDDSGVKNDAKAEKSASARDAPTLPGHIDMDAEEKAQSPAEVQAADVPPQRPLPNRTWVEDDGDLILENGKVTIRKRRLRVVKVTPPPLPLPKMVGGPVLQNPKPTPAVPAVAVAAANRGESRAPVQTAEDNNSPTESRTEDRGVEKVESADSLLPQRRGGGTKRARPLDDANKEDTPPPTRGKPSKRAKHTGAKKPTSKKNASAAERSSLPPAATLNTADKPRLSESEMIAFVEQLPISDLLRRALLIGVHDFSTAANEESEEAEGNNVGSGVSEE